LSLGLKLSLGLELGVFHKSRLHSGERMSCPVRTRCGGDSLDSDVRTFGKKAFFEYGMSARTKAEGESQCEHFSERRRVQFFAILCRRILWTALT